MNSSGIGSILGVFQSHWGDAGSSGTGTKGSGQEGCWTEAVRMEDKCARKRE